MNAPRRELADRLGATYRPTMLGRMTFEEIEGAYPGEWVVVRDFVPDDAKMVAHGVLVAHTPDRDEADRAVRSFHGDFALWFVGPALADGFIGWRTLTR